MKNMMLSTEDSNDISQEIAKITIMLSILNIAMQNIQD